MALPPSILLAALSLLCVPAVFAQDCAPYIDSNLQIHKAQVCVLSFCSGTCVNRYCSLNVLAPLDQGQFLCVLTNLWVVIGVGIALFVLMVGGCITCCCRCCSSGSRHTGSRLAVTHIIPRQPMPIVVPMASPVYQPLPNSPMYAGPQHKGQFPPPYPDAESSSRDNLAFEAAP